MGTADRTEIGTDILEANSAVFTETKNIYIHPLWPSNSTSH